jgi:CHAT domain-containing protein
LQGIHARLASVPPSSQRGAYLVQLAVQSRRLGPSGAALAYAALTEAKASTGDARFNAEVRGELAQLYEDAQRFDEALRLNDEALQAAPGDADDLRLELQWRRARLELRRQRYPATLEAFQRAVEHVEAIRADIPLDYHDGRSSFRDLLEPLYQGYADVLLRQAAAGAPALRQPLLRRARQVVEFIKQSEFEDFLGGRCAVHPVAEAAIDAVAPDAAVLYPIILPDRLELLLSHKGTIQQFTRTVGGRQIRDAARAFAGALRSAQPNATDLARTLYGWLIEPAESYLREHTIQTLVVVPDGILRLIPLAALHDGNHYLTERYALATSPGLSLIAPARMHPHEAATLLAGLDEPGEVVERLPAEFLNSLDVGSSRGLAAARRSRALLLRPSDSARGAASSPAGSARRDDLREALRLPGVAAELKSLQATVPGTVLLGEDFTAARFKRELLVSPYSIVHIASHGILGSTAAESFILAFDDVISLDQLESVLKADKFAKQPVELLTLSACQTAEGDDRAPLGFSGIALKTEVRSALGSLWPVNDEAASKLMVAFYRAFAKPGTSRAAALQQAQRSVLAEPALKHPFFWAPFILVGNWL